MTTYGMQESRDPELIGRLARLVCGHPADHTFRVAIDGPDAAGKTTLADDLAEAVRASGRPALRVSIDDFHRPRHERYRRGPLSPEGYVRDCFDFPALRRLVLHPLGPDGDGRYRPALRDLRTEEVQDGPARLAPPGAVLVVDGVFLLSAELAGCWEVSIHLDVSPAETLRRALVRDVAVFGSAEAVRERYLRRYLPGQQLYREAVEPARIADVVLGYDDPAAPVVVKWPGR
jgi:uridine kinase